MSPGVASWWLLLCAVSAVNVLAWLTSAVALERRWFVVPAEAAALRRRQLLLSAGYVFGCAFRSMFPVYDVQRLCLVDSWLSTVLVGRSVATVAELCFVAQWSHLLRHLSRGRSPVGEAASYALLPLIAVAELCSWHAVLTTSNLGHVIEESIWGGSVALLVLALVAMWPRCEAALRPMVAACVVAGVLYVAYMFLVDVPMYHARWLLDEAEGRDYLGLRAGLLDAASRCTVSARWEDWRSEVVWMTLYFSAAVWLSLALVHWPLRRTRAQ
jgi:hypothetical protein